MPFKVINVVRQKFGREQYFWRANVVFDRRAAFGCDCVRRLSNEPSSFARRIAAAVDSGRDGEGKSVECTQRRSAQITAA